jgi:hypothetical protein
MSYKNTDNNSKQTQELMLQQQSDEAFMNELYDEVSQEDQSQPSELLDQRIISAAHKALTKSTKPKSKSHVTWYSSLATAASITLVISLVVLQQSNILPNEQAGIMPLEEVITEQVDFQEQDRYSAMSSQMENSLAKNARLAANEKTVRAIQFDKQTQLAKQKPAKKAIYLSPLNSLTFEKTEQNIAQEDKAEIIDLSIKQLQQYILSNKTLNAENQWFWSFHSENDMEYIIDIFQKNQQPSQYRLTKHTFKIIGKSQGNFKKVVLKNQVLSKITILNTNN